VTGSSKFCSGEARQPTANTACLTASDLCRRVTCRKTHAIRLASGRSHRSPSHYGVRSRCSSSRCRCRCRVDAWASES